MNHPIPAPRRARAVRKTLSASTLALCVAVALSACGEKKGQEQAGEAPPPEVGVVTVQPGTVTLSTELPGRLESVRTAQVRARATGILLKRVFTEGSDVKENQVLYRIDPAPYDAALQSAKAQLAQAEAGLAQNRATVTRYRPLVEVNAVSKQDFDAAVAAEKASAGQVAAGKAAVRTASINLGYTTVTAPISGRIGRSMVTEGALVSATEATQLAVIQQVNPLYINLTQSAAAVSELRLALQSGQLERAGSGEAAKVEVLYDDGRPYDQPGRLLFTDISVDPGTGQVSLRAEVPNPKGLLLPGMYVRVRLQQAQVQNAVLLPQQAVTRGGPQGDTVLVVGEGNAVEQRVVKVGNAQGTSWVITDGLKADEQVVVDGVQKLGRGTKAVKPVPWSPKGSDPQAASGAAAESQAAAPAPAQAASN
ncbi:efflux RND transporter periplasmic adaptor subunit [Ottowia sp.]|uniref:efflux RND transporter periplasmic adaptor subunit n=1 Tax=Ottowia sp. TaxID=1898956 RepID=UPI003A87667A